MNDLTFFLTKVLNITHHTIIKTCSHGQQHITILHPHVCFIRTMHAQHSNKLLICRRIATQTHQSIGTGETQQTHQFSQLLRRISQDHAATRINHRPFGCQQQLHSIFDLPQVAMLSRIIGADTHRCWIAEFRFLTGYIFRNIHQYWPWATTFGKIECLLNGAGDFLNVFNQEIMLHAWSRYANSIHFLKSIFADGISRHLATDNYHGDRIHIGRSNACNRIGYPGARGDQRDPHLVSGTCVPVGGMYCSLLMTN